jgi:hypothetical protein
MWQETINSGKRDFEPQRIYLYESPAGHIRTV